MKRSYFPFVLHLIILLLIVISFSSCEDKSVSKYEDRCYCPLQGVGLSDIRDSMLAYENDEDRFYTGLDIALPREVLKYFKAELAIGYENKDTEGWIRTIVRKTDNQFPEISNFQYFRNDMYCATINLMCRDTSMSDQALAQKKQELLVVLEEEISSLMLAKINASEKSFTADVKNQQSSSSTPDPRITVASDVISGKRIKRLQTDLREYCASQAKCSGRRIVINHNVEIIPEPLSENTSRLSVGALTVKIDGAVCYFRELPDLVTSGVRISGSPSQLERERSELIENYVQNNHAEIVSALRKCL